MTLSERWLEGEGSGPTTLSALQSGSSGAPVSAVKPAGPAHGRMAAQIPAFAAIGFFGYVLDATTTYLCTKYFVWSPELARPPGFIIATIVNFSLNRSITFRDSR